MKIRLRSHSNNFKQKYRIDRILEVLALWELLYTLETFGETLLKKH